VLSQLYGAHPDMIPLVWDVDDSWGNARYWWYPGDGYVPFNVIGGNILDVPSSFSSFENAYYTTAATISPLEMTVSTELLRNQLLVTADILVTETVTSTNNKLFFVISLFVEDASADYVNKVVAYSGERNFNLTQIGQAVQEQHTFNLSPSWDYADIHAIAVVQSWSGTKDILQAGQCQIPPEITVTSPNGGENWIMNTTHDITWTSVNTSDNVKIDLFMDDAFYASIVSSTHDDGTYNWQIPGTYEESTHYKVKISDINDPSTFDQSDDYFGISPPPEPEIYVNVSEVSSLLNPDEIDDTQSFEITNIGDPGSSLTYEISWEYTTVRSAERSNFEHSVVRGTPHEVAGEIRNYESWLEINPLSGDCLYNETDTIDLIFDSTELNSGTYTALITISNNADTDRYIDVTLEVTGDRDANHPDDVTFQAWITTRPTEILNENSYGCDYYPEIGYILIQCGTFATQWIAGDTLHVEVIDPMTGHTGWNEFVLTSVSFEYMDTIYLAPEIIPDSPQITSVYTSETDIYLNWNIVDGATSYSVYSCSDPYGLFPDDWIIEETGIMSNSWNDQLTGSRKYFVVTAHN